jgi:hypothetical protein
VEILIEKRTHTHIYRRPDERMCNGVDQFTRDAEVAEFDVTLGVAQDVRRLYVCTPSHE